MADKTGLDPDVNTNEAASASNVSGTGTETKLQKGRDQRNSEKEVDSKNAVSFHTLFSFADLADNILMIVGTVSALVNGVTMPLMTLFFGQMIDSFGGNSINKVVDEVSKIALRFFYLGVGAGVASFFQVACWMVTGERQAARIRNLYLKTILRQDISFFDKETNTGEVVGRMSGDMVLIQDAMGEKVGKFIQLIATFLGGFIVAFSEGWLLTLVMLSSIPPLVLSGAIMSVVLTKMATRGQTAYTEAGAIVEQTIGSIRTVQCSGGDGCRCRLWIRHAYCIL